MDDDRKRALGLGCFWAVMAAIALAIGGVWHFLSNFSWTKGRPLRGRSEKKRREAPTENESREEVAARHWHDMAQEEYESIAAFSEVALDLMAAGAPMDTHGSVRTSSTGARVRAVHWSSTRSRLRASAWRARTSTSWIAKEQPIFATSVFLTESFALRR